MCPARGIERPRASTQGGASPRCPRFVRRNLPVLTPGAFLLDACPESFHDMTPVARGRHCGQCNRTVVDMTRMTRTQAEALFAREQEQLCGYVLANDAGDTFFAEATAPRSPRLLAAGLAAALLVSGCGNGSGEDPRQPVVEVERYQWPDSTPPVVTVQPVLPDKPATVTAAGTPPVGVRVVPPIATPRAGGLMRRVDP